MPLYSVITVAAMLGAIAVDLTVLRTGVVRRATFWVSLAIMFFFQIFVDGWLTRASDTIVHYDPDGFSGVRVFFNTPLEDFGFGFAVILLTLSLWDRLGRASGSGAA